MAELVIPLSADELEAMTRPNGGDPKGWGGWQQLIGRIQAGLRFAPETGWQLHITVRDARRVIAYTAPKYGRGTYQNVLCVIVDKISQALRALDEPEQIDLDLEE